MPTTVLCAAVLDQGRVWGRRLRRDKGDLSTNEDATKDEAEPDGGPHQWGKTRGTNVSGDQRKKGVGERVYQRGTPGVGGWIELSGGTLLQEGGATWEGAREMQVAA